MSGIGVWDVRVNIFVANGWRWDNLGRRKLLTIIATTIGPVPIRAGAADEPEKTTPQGQDPPGD
jgi:hypothetical protein